MPGHGFPSLYHHGANPCFFNKHLPRRRDSTFAMMMAACMCDKKCNLNWLERDGACECSARGRSICLPYARFKAAVSLPANPFHRPNMANATPLRIWLRPAQAGYTSSSQQRKALPLWREGFIWFQKDFFTSVVLFSYRRILRCRRRRNSFSPEAWIHSPLGCDHPAPYH